jgi:hypothetical protein
MSETFYGRVDKMRTRLDADRNIVHVWFQLNREQPPFFLAFPDGAQGFDLIQKGAVLEVEAQQPTGGHVGWITQRVRVASRDLVCDLTLAEQQMQKAGQDPLF